jgi:peptide/nickel transport system substrate-binding protein
MKNNGRWAVYVLIFLILAGAGFFGYKYFFQDKKEDSPVASTETIERENLVEPASYPPYNVYPTDISDLSSFNFNSHIFEPLVTFDKDNHVIPKLAVKWDNPDDLTWRFYLSPKAKFSNNDPVTADDIKFSYDYISGKFPSTTKASLPAISEINVESNSVVSFKTSSPNPLLLNQLAYSLLILSKKEVEKNGLANNVGSGPYKLAEKSDSMIRLARNDNYWGITPKVKNLTFPVYQQYPSEEERLQMLLDGKIDFLSLR